MTKQNTFSELGWWWDLQSILFNIIYSIPWLSAYKGGTANFSSLEKFAVFNLYF